MVGSLLLVLAISSVAPVPRSLTVEQESRTNSCISWRVVLYWMRLRRICWGNNSACSLAGQGRGSFSQGGKGWYDGTIGAKSLIPGEHPGRSLWCIPQGLTP